MKRVFIGFFFIILFIVLFKMYPAEGLRKGDKVQEFEFYREEYEERYQQYEKENPNMKRIDVITQVNLGLDFPFYTHTEEAKNLQTSFVLVNKHYYLKEDYVPDQLEEIQSLTHGTRLLVHDARLALEEMVSDSLKDNLQIRVISSYRSYDYQKRLYDQYVQEDGKEKADTYSARPGHSEHQTGLVFDLDNVTTGFENFENTKEFQWMQENAYRYGFILRYPKGKEDITGYDYEAWHYRYVGKDIALQMKETGLTFDEYFARFLDS